jgi:hypothetical protein
MNARVRIKNVRMKSDNVVLLHEPESVEEGNVLGLIRWLLARQGSDIVGVAVVIWGSDNGSVAAIETYGKSQRPEILVPDFVRNRLLGSKIEEWARQ